MDRPWVIQVGEWATERPAAPGIRGPTGRKDSKEGRATGPPFQIRLGFERPRGSRGPTYAFGALTGGATQAVNRNPTTGTVENSAPFRPPLTANHPSGAWTMMIPTTNW